MRGADIRNESLFYYLSPETYIPADHPLRPIRKMVDEALQDMSEEFSRMYSETGRPSIPPEKLLRALIIQALYSIRSARLLMEQIGYSILFRWFVGLSLDDKVWDHSTFSQNQDRLIGSETAARFFALIKAQAEQAGLLSDEHFTVDGTLIEAWASMKSFRPKDDSPSGLVGRNDEVDFHGEKRRNDTHASVTDPDARLYKKGKGKEAKLCYEGHVLMENRNGLIVEAVVTHATGTAERDAAGKMVAHVAGRGRVTLGGDKNYDTHEFVETMREMKVTPHVAQNNKGRESAIDGRTTRHAGYSVSQRVRKRIEETFGWMKTVGNLRKTRYRGIEKVGWYYTLTAAAYNLVRMRNLGIGTP